MVRLQGAPVVVLLSSSPAFNPTMVRLQVGWALGAARLGSLSIPLWCDCKRFTLKNRAESPNFQSHYGAIASAPCKRGSARHAVTFNPTMVRLQVLKRTQVRAIACFQSHYGAIASTLHFCAQDFSCASFNPTMVRLQG